MAYDLIAKLKLIDSFSAPMRKAEDSAKRMQRAVDGVNSSTSRLGRAAGTAGGGFMKLGGAAGRTLSDIASKAARASLAIGGIGAAVVGAGTVAGIVKLSSTALKLSSDAEQASIAFETMLGSADKSKTFLEDLTNFANNTPFELPGLRDSAKKLLAFQFAADQVIPMMTGIGNAASGLSLGADGIDRITLALGQMKAKGKVQGDEMLQLVQAGISGWDILADKMKISTGEVQKLSEKGLIPADKAIQTLIDGMNKQFPNMLEKQSKSLAGMYSTLKDVFNNKILKSWGDGLATTLRPQFEAITNWINANKTTIERWGKSIQQAAGAASDAIARKFEGAFNYVKTHFLDNPEFAKLKTLPQRIEFIISDFATSFSNWYDGGGKEQIRTGVTSMMDFASTVIKDNKGSLGEAGKDLGTAVGQGMLTGLRNFMKDNPLISATLAFIATPGPVQAKALAAASVAAQGYTNQVEDWFKNSEVANKSRSFLQKVTPSYDVVENILTFGSSAGRNSSQQSPEKKLAAPLPAGSRVPDFGIDGSNAGGLSRVPYNGYVSRLHKDETVLTKSEADARREGRGGGGGVVINIPKLADVLNVRSDSDINAIADALATRLNAIGTVMAE